MTRRRPHQLRRSDIKQETDKPTRSIILRYTGPALDFDEYIYGYPDDTFFAVQLDEVPWPPYLEALSQELGVPIDPLPLAPRLKTAVAEALVAGAMVDAPEYMEEVGVDRDVEWPLWERRELERRHHIAETRVTEIVRALESDMKLRAAGFKRPDFSVPSVADFMPREEVPEPSPAVVKVEAEKVAVAADDGEESVEQVEVEEGAYDPGSTTVLRARQAVRMAREAELPQRLPGGMRRRLKKAPPASYIMYGEIMDPRLDLCAAMTDARSMGRADRETVVVEYDGDWPVVVRRYGQDGRTIYKVEDALRRYGIEVPKERAS